MFTPRLLSLAFLPLTLTAAASAQSNDWQRSFPVSGHPSLYLASDDSSVEVHSCGGCRELRARVRWNSARPEDYSVEARQSGNHVDLSLRERRHGGLHLFSGPRSGPRLELDLPSEIDLDARLADGSIRLEGLHGTLAIASSDGSIAGDNLSGQLRLSSADGSIRLRRASGNLTARSSDGAIAVDGRLSSFQLNSSDGSIELALAEGSQLTAPSRLSSSDGSIRLRLPRSLAATLDVATADGSIHNALPITSDGSPAEHRLRGRLNGGGQPIEIRSSDGSVHLGTL